MLKDLLFRRDFTDLEYIIWIVIVGTLSYAVRGEDWYTTFAGVLIVRAFLHGASRLGDKK